MLAVGEELHELFYTSAGWQSAKGGNISCLLQLLCHEQNFVLGQDMLSSAFYTSHCIFLQDIRSLLEYFPTCLEKHASSSHPVVLVLDSLDQQSDDDGGRELDWVPKKLPGNVYVILSTLPGKEYNCFPRLQVINLFVTSKCNHYWIIVLCITSSRNDLQPTKESV